MKNLLDKLRPPVDTTPKVMPSTVIAPQLLEFLGAVREKRWTPGMYHASGLYNMCPREAQFIEVCQEKGMKFTEQVEAARRVTFDIGHAMNIIVRDYWLKQIGGLYGHWRCRACGKTIEGVDLWGAPCPKAKAGCGQGEEGRKNMGRDYMEIELVDNELNIVGSMDGVLVGRGPLPDEDVGLEIKTIYRDGFRRLEEPYPSHVYQVNIYMHMAKLRSCVILYVSKEENDPPLKEFLVTHDPKVMKAVRRDLGELAQAKSEGRWAKGVCPTDKTKRAGTCFFKEVCFGKAATVLPEDIGLADFPSLGD